MYALRLEYKEELTKVDKKTQSINLFQNGSAVFKAVLPLTSLVLAPDDKGVIS